MKKAGGCNRECFNPFSALFSCTPVDESLGLPPLASANQSECRVSAVQLVCTLLVWYSVYGILYNINVDLDCI